MTNLHSGEILSNVKLNDNGKKEIGTKLARIGTVFGLGGVSQASAVVLDPCLNLFVYLLSRHDSVT